MQAITAIDHWLPVIGIHLASANEWISSPRNYASRDKANAFTVTPAQADLVDLSEARIRPSESIGSDMECS